MEINGKTRLCGLIGNPVEHTVSPEIHNTLADRLGINLAYMPFFVKKGMLQDAVKGAQALNALGVNVTIPYKTEVIPFLAEIDPAAEMMESVNTLVPTQKGFKGYNTDLGGLYRAMTEDGVVIEGQDVILVGCGGVGRTAAFLCAMKGARNLFLLNRDPSRAQQLAGEVAAKTGHKNLYPLALADWNQIPEGKYLAVQCTSVGLHPDSDAAPIADPAFYQMIHTGYDLIYRPAVTKFMQMVENAGGCAYNGLKMLIYQGVEAFELWNGTEVPGDLASEVYEIVRQKVIVE